MLWQIALCLVIVWGIFDHFYRKYVHRSLKCIAEIDIPCFPIIGQAHTFLGNDEDRMNAFKRTAESSTRLGGVGRFWYARRLLLVVTDASQIEELLKVFITKDDIMEIMQTLTGNGSIFAPVAIWQPRRKQLIPAFSPRNLKRFMPVFAGGSDILVHRLQAVCEEAPQPLWNYLATYSLDAACITTFGVNLKIQNNPEQPFLIAFEKVIKCLAQRVCQPWLQVNWLYQLLPQYRMFRKSLLSMYDFINEIIKVRRTQRKQEYESAVKTDRNRNVKTEEVCSFMDILLNLADGTGGISNEDLRDEGIVISTAGTDTSAVGIGFVLSMLARHPEVQTKVFEEIQKVFNDSKRPITSQDLLELNYLDAVVRESLRLYPPVPVIVRKVTSYEKLSTLPTLVPGMGLVINIWGVHRNPKYWGPDAEEFRPERFLESTVRHPAAFIPFSNGPRNCIGYQYAMMSIKTVITNIVRHYYVSVPNECLKHKMSSERHTDCAGCKVEPLRLKFDIMMKDNQEFKLKLERRK